MGKPNLSAQLPEVTLRQLEDLKPLFNGNKTQVVIRAIALLHKQEIKTMTTNLSVGQLDDITYGPGLYATYSQSYTAYAASDMDDADGTMYYSIKYCKEAMPPHKTSDFATVAELTAAMQETATLDKWLTIELDEDDEPTDDE